MLEAIQKGLFSQRFHLRSQGAIIAEFKVSTWHKARFELDDELFCIELKVYAWHKANRGSEGELFRFYREGLITGAFVLEKGDEILGRAETPSVRFSRFFSVHLAGRRYLLKKRSTWSRSFDLYEDGVTVGSLRWRGFFIRRVEVNLPQNWPIAEQVFICWLVLVFWTHETAAGE